ncbi:RNA polymerase sigma factor [Gandjariella thermophila]|uniref:RNA polymerase sigma factor SigS n=1 Tax=Gandjariella thermophila TaxID=1931992 RepID=A0A4D4J9I3_9PSEU|nr:sigma-70 family RNA polymerase sigma factor [Gandjariella thermophila]GDY31069.1 ECF RNA polymerase sigma factor SigL [Gandjariella thermophila]
MQRQPGGSHALEAPAGLWEEYLNVRAHLLRVAVRHAGTPAQAEDIVHDALIRAAEFGDLDLARLRPFLVAVVKRLCADEARRSSTARRVLTHTRLRPDPAGDPADRACDRAEADWVAARCATLSAYERSLLSLAAEGMSAPDIARRLGTTAAATQSAMYRIRAKIRTWLGVDPRVGRLRR